MASYVESDISMEKNSMCKWTTNNVEVYDWSAYNNLGFSKFLHESQPIERQTEFC